jgi:hypothetical protein
MKEKTLPELLVILFQKSKVEANYWLFVPPDVASRARMCGRIVNFYTGERAELVYFFYSDAKREGKLPLRPRVYCKGSAMAHNKHFTAQHVFTRARGGNYMEHSNKTCGLGINNTLTTNVLVERLVILHIIHEIPGSTITSETGYSDSGTSWFSRI